MADTAKGGSGRAETSRRDRIGRLFGRLSYGIAVALAIVCAAPWTLVNSPERISVQNLLFDEFQRWRPRVYATPPPIRIVEIDDESVARLGRWPWPRARIGEMIAKIADAGASAVALDVLLYDLGDPADDAALAKAIQGRPVVLGEYFTGSGNAARLPDKAGFSFAGDDPTPFAYALPGAMAPLPDFVKAAAGVGFLNWLPDNDRVVRRVPLVMASGGRLTPSFAMEALRVAQGAAGYTIKSSNASGEAAFGVQTGMVAIRNGDAIATTGARGDIRIHFAGDDRRMRIPAWRVLEPGADLSELARTIVFVGATGELMYDIVATPLSPEAPGVLQHAEIVAQVLMDDRLSRPDWAPGAEFLFTAGASLTLAALLPFVSTAAGALMGLAVAAGSGWGSWWAYSRHGLLFDPIMPTLATGAVYIVGMLALYARKQGEARKIRAMFGFYVSPAMVDRLAADPSLLRLGGEERQVTIMFSDLRGFTTLSEGKSATELTSFLNAYLTPMTDVVLETRGTVDKYIGDAIMAFWNAPVDDKRHAHHAVEAALAMRARLADLNFRWAEDSLLSEQAYEPVRFGIGLNTGSACVGNLGSRTKFNYSVIGDEVNVASRLESATKQFGVDIVASEATRAQAPDFAWLEIDDVVFKNKTHAIGVHALAGDKSLAASPAFDALRREHEDMMRLYRAGDGAAARAVALELTLRAPEPIRGLYIFNARRFSEREGRSGAESAVAALTLDEK